MDLYHIFSNTNKVLPKKIMYRINLIILIIYIKYM